MYKGAFQQLYQAMREVSITGILRAISKEVINNFTICYPLVSFIILCFLSTTLPALAKTNLL